MYIFSIFLGLTVQSMRFVEMAEKHCGQNRIQKSFGRIRKARAAVVGFDFMINVKERGGEGNTAPFAGGCLLLTAYCLLQLLMVGELAFKITLPLITGPLLTVTLKRRFPEKFISGSSSPLDG